MEGSVDLQHIIAMVQHVEEWKEHGCESSQGTSQGVKMEMKFTGYYEGVHVSAEGGQIGWSATSGVYVGYALS